MGNTLPWYRSKIVVGAIISGLSKLLVISGVASAIAPADEEQLTDILVLAAGGVADLVIFFSRWGQREAPKITARKGITDA